MNATSLPKVIAVILWGDDYTPISWGKYNSILGRSVTEWRIHKPNLKSESQSLFARVFRPNAPYQSQMMEAQRFVIENYNRGDHVMLLDWWLDDIGGPRYTAIRQLATALTTGSSARTFESNLPSDRIPIKCIYLDFSFIEIPQHSIIDRVLSDFPSTVENLLFMSSQQACAVQRGTDGRVMRKEMWLKSEYLGRAWVDWFMVHPSNGYSSGAGTL
ncbi:hypothetical protein BDV93DRAFT_607778 [Ceratobasidium sp. AG-I]|nr:hypothetical protein BDV93DRAFT_607778 [Ceratobasidium sp. AG-I]